MLTIGPLEDEKRRAAHAASARLCFQNGAEHLCFPLNSGKQEALIDESLLIFLQ